MHSTNNLQIFTYINDALCIPLHNLEYFRAVKIYVDPRTWQTIHNGITYNAGWILPKMTHTFSQ